MPRQCLISPNASTYVTASSQYVGTRDYVSISFQGSSAFLEFSGSSSPTQAHQSIRHRVSTVSMPSDADVTTASSTNLDSRRNVSVSSGSFSNGNTVYCKALFYSGSGGSGGYDAMSATLTKSGDNTTSGSLIWRPVYEMHAWDGAAWRRFDTQLAITLVSAYGVINSAFDWDVFYTLDTTAPTGYSLSVRLQPADLETGPYDVSGTSSGNFNIPVDPSATYLVQLVDDTSTPLGTPISVTPA